MNEQKLTEMLNAFKNGDVSLDAVTNKIKSNSYSDMGHTKIDTHRELRNGYPEVIYSSGKSTEQIQSIIKAMDEKGSNILATRASEEVYTAVKETTPSAIYHKEARIISVENKKQTLTDTYIAVVSAGTSDIPVCEEAAVTAHYFGNKVERLYDVGVAGIHRLFDNLDVIRGARVVIAVAGMEGALASVLGGLVDKPVIAVPTSVGYGANFGGLSALLGMLTSCASGTSVVNIDNGFGAAYMASMINKL